jgi:hypothetical protein
MRKPSVRGSSAATHPAADATLLALVKACLEIEARHRAAEDHLIIAEERRKEPKPPREVLRTEADLQLGLFVGSSLGSPYSETEIKALRVFCHSHAHTNIASNEETSAYFRAVEILRGWATWQGDVRQEEERSGYAKAEAVDRALADEHDALLSQIALARPTTIDGLLAKVRAARWTMARYTDAERSELAHARLVKSLSEFGPDEDAMQMSLMRDLFDLASRRA